MVSVFSQSDGPCLTKVRGRFAFQPLRTFTHPSPALARQLAAEAQQAADLAVRNIQANV